MAVGRGAQAGPDSITIGAGSKAGSAVTLGQATPDRSIILRAWKGVQAAASIAGASWSDLHFRHLPSSDARQ